MDWAELRLTPWKIGALLSSTRERTRQLQNRALKSLKERLDPRLADAFAS